MASRLNTRLLALVVVAVVGVGALLGGFGYLRYRADATRNVRQGDEFMDKGDYGAAYGAYGRALSKEPTNLVFVDKATSALTKIVPKTRFELRERFGDYQKLLENRVGIAPTRAESHVPVIDLRLLLAQLGGAEPASWTRLEDAGKRMAESLDKDDPARFDGLLYTAYGALGRRDLLEPKAFDKAIATLREVIKQRPDDDLANALLAESLLGEGARRRRANRSDPQAAALEEEGRAALRTAVERCPDGPLVADMVLRDLLVRREVKDPAATPEAVRAAASRLLSTLNASTPSRTLDRVASSLLTVRDVEVSKQLAALMATVAAAQPSDAVARQVQMVTLAAAGDYDGCAAVAESILEEPPQPVGIEAMLQSEGRVQAATTLFNIAYARLASAAPADRARDRAAAEQAMGRLREQLDRPESDPALIRSEGRIAAATERWNEALAKFEQVVRLMGAQAAGPDLLYETAFAAARAGETGLAKRRLDEALAITPRYLDALTLKADLEQRDGNNEAARRTIALAKEIDPNDERVKRVDELTSLAQGDALTIVITTVQQRFDRGDVAGARGMIEEALATHPGEPRLCRAGAFIELSLGENEKAAALARAGLESAPDDVFLQRALTLSQTTDSVRRIELAVETETEDGPDRVARTYASLARAAASGRRLANERAAAGASDAPTMNERATALEAAAQSRRAAALALDPPHPAVLRVEIERLIDSRDFAAAQTQLDAPAAVAAITGPDRALLQAQLSLGRADSLSGDAAQSREQLADVVRTLDAALQRNPESTDLLLLRGRVLTRLGNFPDALASVESAYSQRPADMTVVETYAGLLQRLGEQARLLQVLREAARQRDVSPAVRSAWLNAEALIGNRSTALFERRLTQTAAPDDLANGIALATLLLTLPPSRELIVDGSGRERIPQDRWAALPPEQQRASLDTLRREWLDECGRMLDVLEKRHPQAFEIAALRADLARAAGKPQLGVEAVRKAIAAAGDKSTVQMHLVLGGLLESVGDTEGMTAAFNIALKKQGDAREADRFLASRHASKGEWDKALPRIKLIVDDGGDQREQLMYAEALARTGDLDGAEAAFFKAVGDTPPSSEAVMLQATILGLRLEAAMAAGSPNVSEIESRLAATTRRAQELRPGDPAPLLAEAQGLVASWRRRPQRTPQDPELARALEVLDRAIALRADNWPVARLRAQLLVEKGESTQARMETERLVKLSPLNIDARIALIDLWLQALSLDKAIAVAREGVELRPLDSRMRRALGDLLDRTGDVSGAIAEHRRADEMAPGDGADRLVMLMLKSSPAHAPEYPAVVQLLEKRPGELKRSVYLEAAYGAALANTGKRTEGLNVLRSAFAGYKKDLGDRPELISGWFDQLWLVFPVSRTAEAEQFVTELSGGMPGPFELRELGLRYAEAGPAGLEKALALLRQATEASGSVPARPRAELYFDLGNVLFGLDRCAESIPAFEQATQLAPENPGAVNNLAYMLLTCTNDPARALPIARRAVALAPGEQAFHDTLGEVLAKLGQDDAAEKSFRSALAIARTPLTHVHLAAVLARTGRGAEARAELRKAAELDPAIRDSPEYRAVDAATAR